MKKNFRSFKSRSEKGELACGGSIYRSQRGVALVITLIMLSVTLVMAMAFLAISRRDRASVSSTTDITTARLAADSALAQAQAKIIANLAVYTNLNSYSLLVSTNYINPDGFLGTFTFASPNNVNYSNALATHQPLLLAQNIANLQVLPRAPVFMGSNEPVGRYYLDLNRNGTFEPNGYQPQVDANGRYYHTNGTVAFDLTGVVSNFMVGDPEWIGILARPDAPHSANNQFIGRYAFLAQPIGNTLDFNYIHNQAVDTVPLSGNPMNINNDSYYRNQGVGSWEINLAAFFADLDTNVWDTRTNEYEYNQPFYRRANTGFAFRDAFSVLNYRYADYYSSQASAFEVYSNEPFANDNIDEYSDGPLQTNTANILESIKPDLARNPWLGADNTNRFFTFDDLFKVNETINTLATNLIYAGNNFKSTYDRYAYYRMLDQIGMDSAPETGKLNLNYDNVTSTTMGIKGYASTASVTNFLPWKPMVMFTNVAERLLRANTTAWYQTPNPPNLPNYYQSNYLAVYFGYHTNGYLDINGAGFTNFPYFGMTNQIPSFGVTNIPVIYNGNVVYASSVNRLLQLAANIVDATSNNFYPSVFKPDFYRTNSTVVINGYKQVTNYIGTGIGNTDFVLPEDFNGLLNDAYIRNPTNTVPRNVWGIPWIIGAKKGFPNFNEFSFENTIDVTRRLQFKKSSAHDVVETNQSFIFRLNTQLGIELWNSYTNAYPTENLTVYVYDTLNIWAKNSNNISLMPPVGVTYSFYTNPVLYTEAYLFSGTTNRTVGFKPGSFQINPPNPNSFFVPLNISTNLIPPMEYTFYPPGLVEANSGSSYGLRFDSSPPQVLPAIFLQTTNHLRVWMVDNNHVIDYVQFAGPVESTNIVATFQSTNALFTAPNEIQGVDSDMWSTSLTKPGVPTGVANQIAVSRGAPKTVWSGANQADEMMVDGFAVFMSGSLGIVQSLYPQWASDPYVLAQLDKRTNQAPYDPTVTIRDYMSWQANDPLVHYFAGDLPFYGTEEKLTTGMHPDGIGATNLYPLPNIGALNDRYGPWGLPGSVSDGNPTGTGARNPLNTAVQDPLVWSSDFWAFPTNKFPSVGWLGRVHRGTPWQTVYLKSRNVWTQTAYGPTTWENWTSDLLPFDAWASSPTADRLLFDLFTAEPNDNASRGLLSVNQKGLAAWSALFGGMVALTNINLNNSAESGTIFNYGWANINPAGINSANSPLGQIVNEINATRANTNLFPSGTFQHVGDILSTTNLTDQSPFFNTNPVTGGSPFFTNEITDAAYEWLPEQALPLLKLDPSPRYVIYCYGQALKPVQGAQVTSGVNFGLTTNYQVVAESAAKAVVQVHANIVIQNGRSVTNYTTTVESYNALPPDYVSP